MRYFILILTFLSIFTACSLNVPQEDKVVISQIPAGDDEGVIVEDSSGKKTYVMESDCYLSVDGEVMVQVNEHYSVDSCLHRLAYQQEDNKYCESIEKERLKDFCYSKTPVELNSFWILSFVKAIIFSIIIVGFLSLILRQFPFRWQKRLFYLFSLLCFIAAIGVYLDEWKFNYLLNGGIGHHLHSILFGYFLAFFPFGSLLLVFFTEKTLKKKIPTRAYRLLTAINLAIFCLLILIIILPAT